ncbi:MAG: hypothetical protein ACOH2L_19025 [Devosia sp.]
MARRVTSTRMNALTRAETTVAALQPIFAGQEPSTAVRPVPSLAALEQVGGAEMDGRLELPTRELWTTRMSPDLLDD